MKYNCDRCQCELDDEKDYTSQNYTYEKGAKESTLVSVHCFNCQKEETIDRYLKTGRLTGSLIGHAELAEIYQETRRATIRDAYQRALGSRNRIRSLVKEFESRVWFGGLQKLAQNAKTKGTSFEHKDFKFLCYTMGGRAVITLDTPKAAVTVITAEDSTEPVMGLNTLDATEEQAMAILETAIRLWAADHRVQEDQEVRLAGL
jgi:hypothetical protein